MNQTQKQREAEYLAARARQELSHLNHGELKRLRKQVRGMVMKDLQRRAIVGGESPFKRGGV